METQEQAIVQLFIHWDIQRSSEEQVLLDLQNKGFNDSQIIEICSQYKKKKQDIKQKKGFILMAIGAVLGFLSCLFTMLDFFPEWRGVTLYGLTTIGVGVAFLGAYFVFE